MHFLFQAAIVAGVFLTYRAGVFASGRDDSAWQTRTSWSSPSTPALCAPLPWASVPGGSTWTTTSSSSSTTTTSAVVITCSHHGPHATFQLQVSPAIPTFGDEYLIGNAFQEGSAGPFNFTLDDNCDLVILPDDLIASTPYENGAYTINFYTAAEIASTDTFPLQCDIVGDILICVAGESDILQASIFDTFAIGPVLNSGDTTLVLDVQYVT